jgi:glycosyltransferase involved in cell wall biosynthesis
MYCEAKIMKFDKEKLRLLVMFPSTERGGTEEYALTIASAAVKHGWDVYAAFPQTNGTASLIQSFKEQGIYYHCLDISEPKNNDKFKILKYIFLLLKTLITILKIQPDVVQINLPWFDCCFGSILACGFLRIPTVIVFHLFPERASFSLNKLKIYNWARDRNQQWIGISEHNRKQVCESFNIPDNEVFCIYNGAKLIPASANSSFEEISELRYQLCQQLRVPPNSELILTVGRLSLQKGHTDLIPAIPHIAKEFPNVKFVWVGDGEEREYLANKVRNYGVEDKVLFLGYRSDVPDLLKASDLFVFPTQFEGQPFALIEAMAHNLPIVSSDACGIPELIKDREQGLIFRTADGCDLLETLRWALRHPDQMKEMAINAKLRAQDFSEERMTSETLKLLEKLIYTRKQVEFTKSSSSKSFTKKVLDLEKDRPIKIQIISRSIPAENTDGSNAYMLDFLSYLRKSGCEVQYISIESSPNKQLPWFVISSSLKIFANVQVRNNWQLGHILLRFNLLSNWITAPIRLIYYQVPQNIRSIYTFRFIKVIKNIYNLRTIKKQEISKQEANTTIYNAKNWRKLIATPEEISFAKTKFDKFKPDVVVANYVYLANILDALSIDETILKVILTHDLFHQRTAHFNQIGVAMDEGDWDWEVESEQLSKAQVLLAIQKEDAKVFKEMAPKSEVICMPKSGLCHSPTVKQLPGRCLFVGGGAPHNYSGLQWFLENVWTKVIQLHPNSSLHVCGSVCDSIQGTFPSVRFLGRVDNLEPEYGAAEVCLVPLLAGSGLKIKLVEAMSYGRACVSTSVGVQGLGEIVGKTVLLADTAEDFAAAIHTLLTNPNKRQQMEEQAHQYVMEKLSPEAAYQPFVDRIEQHFQQVLNKTKKELLNNELSSSKVLTSKGEIV